jgi:hypothetical protein
MSIEQEDSLIDHVSGVFPGIALIVVGLVVTIGDISIGAVAGIPMVLLGILVPMLMTYNAREESQRQEARRRPDRDAGGTYTLTSKKSRRR